MSIWVLMHSWLFYCMTVSLCHIPCNIHKSSRRTNLKLYILTQYLHIHSRPIKGTLQYPSTLLQRAAFRSVYTTTQSSSRPSAALETSISIPHAPRIENVDKMKCLSLPLERWRCPPPCSAHHTYFLSNMSHFIWWHVSQPGKCCKEIKIKNWSKT